MLRSNVITMLKIDVSQTVDSLVVMISKMGSLIKIRVRYQFRIIEKIRMCNMSNIKSKGGLRNESENNRNSDKFSNHSVRSEYRKPVCDKHIVLVS